MKKFFVVSRLLLVVCLLLPLAGFAHVPPLPYWATDGLLACNGSGGNSNPCQSLCDLVHTFVHFVYFGITLALFIAAPILFAWGGIMMMLAGGDPGKMQSAKKILTGTLIGVLITLGAYLIVATFIKVLEVGNYVGGFGTAFKICSFD